MSPIVTRNGMTFDDVVADSCAAGESNPFGGFSFVASKSLLEDDDAFMLDDA